MIRENLLSALFKPLAPRTEELCFILNNTNNVKELGATVELLVKCMFGLETESNLTQADKLHIQWPLNTTSKYHNDTDFVYMFNFLNTDSLFWSVLFKLTNLNVNFKYPISMLPLFVKNRIECGNSFLSTRVDTISCLNLSALEYYLLCFISSIVNVDQQKTTGASNNRIYNEQNGSMCLNSTYADLLDNYLNYFLPIDKCDVDFPSLNPSNKTNDQNEFSPTKRQQVLSATNHPRLLKLNQTTQFLQTSTNFEPKDRTSELSKIDFLLHLIVDLWLSPFTNDFCTIGPMQTSSTPLLPNIDIVFAIRQTMQHVYGFANTRLRKPFDVNNNSASKQSNIFQSSNAYSIPIDELRLVIVDKYFKKPMYRFFKYCFDNWPLRPTIKFLIETWLCYIQPWQDPVQPIDQDNVDGKQVFILSTSQPAYAKWADFIRSNLFTYSEILILVIKRYLIIDLTLMSNLNLLKRFIRVFHQKSLLDIIINTDNEIAILQSITNTSPTSNVPSMMRRSQEHAHIATIKFFIDFDKKLTNYKSLFDRENLKLMQRLVDSLANTKNLISIQQKSSKDQNSWTYWLKTLFTGILIQDSLQDSMGFGINRVGCRPGLYWTNDKDSLKYKSLTSSSAIQQSFNLNSFETGEVFELIDECKNSLRKLIQQSVDSNHSTPTRSTVHSISEDITADYSKDEWETLSDRYQMVNGICKTKFEKFYDPNTAPINDFENRFLVYILQKFSDLINEKLQQGYKRNDFIGHVCHRILYGPLDAQDKIPLKHSKINSEACLSFRFAADYRFLFYFFIFFLTFKSMCHLNNSFCFLLSLTFGLFYILIKCIFTYEKPRLAN